MPFTYSHSSSMTIFKESSIQTILKEINEIDTDLLLFVVDGKVWEKYGAYFDFKSAFPDKKVHLWKNPEGERAKLHSEYVSCTDFFLEKGVHRHAHLIAVGGGATSDFAGFVAATLLRGLSWSIVPTTVLAMVDASLGGKVSINTKAGKNLLGAFHSPEKVWADLNFLKTLSPNEMRSGKGEILKYAFLDKGIYDAVMSSNGDLREIIPQCAGYKLKITASDFRERGLRKLLNLGHTFGHGLEKIYNLPHGEAVMWGLALVCYLFDRQQLISELQQLKLTLQWPEQDPPWLHKTFPTKDILFYAGNDKKKHSNSEIDFVVPEAIGDVKIKTMPFQEIEEMIIAAESNLKKFRL
ncbi:MAG: 3-dehydroquinate synthase [Bdellovibrio sp.]|nr:3-dehydroquinate synthase [Bdellovibrio sp.]